MAGRLFAVVGPSGAGKDTLMAAVSQRRPDLHLVRRVITRPSDAGGEEFDGVTEAEFLRMRDAGGFAIWWQAHGLFYGIPAGIDAVLAEGRDVVFNGSRGVLRAAAQRYPGLVVLHVTASVPTLAARLSARGRESAADIARRLDRASYALPGGLDVRTIHNDGTLAAAVDQMLGALQPESV
ncbi:MULTISPECIES: phosphonate metabolism protein/1,5-bisphosphokinase (PRPP-forming) PhnN [Actibacterium]|uniref:Ribose 1,5-bisphosphate phosphokinase PhnN n=1 Tax=Actibacterium naphthalenivorans TaxID=1614693 RepID=A0A840CIV9_9RHOB|nr:MULTISPECIES: phosphonate metabolism protein/1,5-bisphosphokinase (PRPP-forming) PhnN [Actibacterium]ALG90670.1 ribose-phosphate pyrophosphokinase [Actibacterium sp. EMB200-NS6]MBB4023139.1 ribose 1,5-bisphosphokinase [Actibacterium naphthalenivorans]